LPDHGSSPRLSVRAAVNHQLESWMREIRTSSSEGGGAKSIVSPYPYHQLKWAPV